MTALLLRSVSGQQRLDNFNRTHLVQAQGRPVLPKNHTKLGISRVLRFLPLTVWKMSKMVNTFISVITTQENALNSVKNIRAYSKGAAKGNSHAKNMTLNKCSKKCHFHSEEL